MVYTKIYIDNFFSFHNFEIDFLIPKKIKDSTIENEHLVERPKFQYKKVCILSGGNASGKTSLGKALCVIQNFISKRGGNFFLPNDIIKNVTKKNKTSTFVIEYATNENKLHHLKVTFKADSVDSFEIGIVRLLSIEYSNVNIAPSETGPVTRKKLEKVISSKGEKSKSDYYFIDYSDSSEGSVLKRESFNQKKIIDVSVWNYSYSEALEDSLLKQSQVDDLDLNFLEIILTTFDSSITSVEKSKDDNNEYLIKFVNKDFVRLNKDGSLSNSSRLSRGTCEAIKIAHFYSWMKGAKNPILYLDEQMAFSHSELEQTILNLIIESLGDNSQFFYTTHNYDILDLNLPIHSYLFLKKDKDETIPINPSEIFNKNDRKLLNYVKNDVFNTIPKTNRLDGILFDL